MSTKFTADLLYGPLGIVQPKLYLYLKNVIVKDPNWDQMAIDSIEHKANLTMYPVYSVIE